LGYAFYLFGKHVPFARRRIRGYVRTELLAFLGVCTALALGKAAHSGSVTLVALAASYMLAGVVGGWVGIGARVGGSPELQLRREMRSYAMWVVLATAVAFAAANLPVTVLAFRGGSAALADGARLAALTALLAPAYLLPRAVGMNLLVDISEQFGSAEGAPRALLAKVLMALVAMSLFGVLLVAVCGDSIAAFVTRSYEPEIGIAFRRLVLGTIVLLVTTPISNLLSGTGRVHLTALASVSQAVVTLGGVMLVEPSLGPFAGWILVGSLVKAVVTTVAASRVAAAPAWHAALALVSVTCVGAWLLIDAADGAAVAAVLAAFGCSVAAWRLLRWHRASSTAGGGSG
jgi:O-antigen/teichoic acid export membrane protein